MNNTYALVPRRSDLYVAAFIGTEVEAIAAAQSHANENRGIYEVFTTDPTCYRRMGWMVERVAFIRPVKAVSRG